METSHKGQLLPREGKLGLLLQTVRETDWGKADGFPDGREHSPADGEGCLRGEDDKGKK